MSISFVIPVWKYTSKNDISRSLNSLDSFGSIVDEVVVVFDGYSSFELEINPPKNIKNKITYVYVGINKGPGCARNLGVLFSHYEYIFMLDAGDTCLPNRINIQLKDLKKYGVSYGAIKYSLRSGYYISRKINKTLGKFLLPLQNPYPNCCLAIKKKIFISLNGYPLLRTAEDWVLAAKLINFFDYIPYSDDPVIECLITDKNKNLISRRYGFRILKRIIIAHYLMIKMRLYNFIFFPFAISYQIILRLFPYRIFKFLYNLRLKIAFKNN